MSLNKFWISVIAVLAFACMVMAGGCSGFGSITLAGGGTFYDTKHPDAAEIVKNTPIIATTTKKSWNTLPMVQGKK